MYINHRKERLFTNLEVSIDAFQEKKIHLQIDRRESIIKRKLFLEGISRDRIYSLFKLINKNGLNERKDNGRVNRRKNAIPFREKKPCNLL